MGFNPNIHHRKSYRLKGYDYSQEGLYFLTICTKDREYFFGRIEIVGGLPVGTSHVMSLNDVGKIADECWLEIPKHFPNAILHEHIVMPNHVHGIIELTAIVGTSHVMSPHVVSPPNDADISGTRHVVSLHNATQQPQQNKFSKPISGSVSVIIQQFKSSVKRSCNKNGNENFQWQSRFHDHIIRNNESYQRIADYILNNPSKWQDDKFYKQ